MESPLGVRLTDGFTLQDLIKINILSGSDEQEDAAAVQELQDEANKRLASYEEFKKHDDTEWLNSCPCSNVLYSEGCSSKEDARFLFDKGHFEPTPYHGHFNYGKKTHAKLATWLGYPEPRTKNTEKAIRYAYRMLQRHGATIGLPDKTEATADDVVHYAKQNGGVLTK